MHTISSLFNKPSNQQQQKKHNKNLFNPPTKHIYCIYINMEVTILVIYDDKEIGRRNQ